MSNNFVGKIASDLQSSNMQRHMGTMENGVSRERAKALQGILNFEFQTFMRLLYQTVLGDHEKYWDGRILNEYLKDNEDDLIPFFTKINDECLDDPMFSEAIARKEEYKKDIYSEPDEVLFYPKGSSWSVTRKVNTDVSYIPSAREGMPNIFRIEVKEKLSQEEYPYIDFGVEIGDDGSINQYGPVIVDWNSKIKTSMNNVHILFNEGSLEALRDTLIKICKKAGIKEEGITR